MSVLRGPRHVLLHLWRHLAIIIVISAVVAGIAFALRSAQTDEYESVARVAFVEDTRFDYLQAERDRLVGFVEDFVSTQIAEDEIVDVDFFRPDRETFLDVVVRGTDARVTQASANDIAERIVVADQKLRTEAITTELSARSTQLVEIERELADLQAEIAEQTEREGFAEANRFAGDLADIERLTIQLRDAQDRLFLAIRYRNAAIESQIRTSDRIDELEIALDITEAETRVVRPALLAGEPAGPGPFAVAFIAGISALALCALGFGLAATDTDAVTDTERDS